MRSEHHKWIRMEKLKFSSSFINNYYLSAIVRAKKSFYQVPEFIIYFMNCSKKKIIITHIHFLLGIENAAVIPNGAKIIAKIFNNYHYLKTIATKNCNCIFISLRRVAHLCNLNNKRIIQEIPHFGNQWNQKWFTLIES